MAKHYCQNGCRACKTEVNGLREVVRDQGEFILKLKQLIADYSGEGEQWKKRLRNGSN